MEKGETFMQDDRNDASISERSAPAPGMDDARQRDLSAPLTGRAQSGAHSEEIATTSSVATVDNANEENASDERDEMESESDAAETANDSNDPPTAEGTNPASAAAQADQDEDDRSELAKQPYDCAPHHAA
jgi:hypothetical protein